MRIEFLTQDDPLYVLPFFEEFFRHYAQEFEIVQVSACPVMGKRNRSQLLKELFHLYGLIGMVRVGARAMMARILGHVPRRARPTGRYYTLEQLCRAYGVPYVSIGDPNSPESVAATRSRAPEALVSVACPYILKDTLLSLPPLGCINIHHAPLPRYKGMMPTFWQMYHGEKQVGVTVHYMAAKVDEGSALLQEELAIVPGETLDHLIRRSKRHGAHCMAKVLRQVAEGTQSVIRFDPSSGSYFTFPTLSEIREFHRRGFRAV